MKGNKLCWVVLCILVVASCNWSSPHLLRENEQGSQPGMCVDTKTNNTYVVYGVTKFEADPESYICLREIRVSDTISEETCTRQDTLIQNVTIACGNDGKHLYVAYAGRESEEKSNCLGSHAGCYDIYFIETSNIGKTWTKALPVPRPNMSDVVHRTDPKLLYITETGRLILAYSKAYIATNKFYLTTAMRVKGSQIFANEVQQESHWGSPLMNKTLVYMMMGGKPQISIFLDSKGYCFQRRYSIDNGQTWKAECIIKDDNIPYAVAMSQRKDRIYIAVGSLIARMLSVGWLLPDNTWKERYFSANEPLRAPIIAEISSKSHEVLLSGYMSFTYLSTFTYDTDENSLTDLKEFAIINPHREAATVCAGTSPKVRVLLYKEGDLYISTHT